MCICVCVFVCWKDVNPKPPHPHPPTPQVGTYPLYGPYWTAVTSTAGTNGMLHIPFAASAVGVFFNQKASAGRMRACVWCFDWRGEGVSCVRLCELVCAEICTNHYAPA